MPPKKTAKPKPSRAAIPVRIRMYRQGLGDCFLITFAPGPKAVHMLIDCGSLGAATTQVKLAEVVGDICKTTGNHLDLLVVTHEHKDHVCAFYDQKDNFKDLKVDHVWMAWTEDARDPLAKKLARPKDLAVALTHAAKALAAAPDHESAQLGLAVQDIIGFSGDPQALGAADDFAKTVNAAMDFARTGFPGATTQFHKPGEAAIEPAWLPGFRFYVLGPPYSEDKLNDTGEQGSAQLYGLAARLQSGAMAAAGAAVDYEAQEADMPFDIRFRLQKSDPLVAQFLQDYLAKSQAWRRIDYDWLHAAADLALQLDSITNNTSLALAIERISDGKVFLFPADAQQGNWLSWHDPQMKWIVKEGRVMRKVAAADLLNRTVFYKVGHHSSHNATAREKGLELMQKTGDPKKTSQLIAFIPVDRAIALKRHPKGSWKMPAKALYRRLLEKCDGRVLRSDIGWAKDSKTAVHRSVEKEFDELATPAEWTQWQASQAKVPLGTDPGNRLYFEVTIP